MEFCFSITPRQARAVTNGKLILYLFFYFFLNKFFLDKHQSPGALARSSSANELALRKKNNLTSKKYFI